MYQIDDLPPLNWVQWIKTLFLNHNFLPACNLAHDQIELLLFTLNIAFALKEVVIGD